MLLPTKTARPPIKQLADIDERSREIFRQVVEAYLETGEPVGSRLISRALPMKLSPASVRNVMTDLEERGLIFAPHTSAGRMPTQSGLRMFVDGLLEVGNVSQVERNQIKKQMAHMEQTRDDSDRLVEDVLSEASELLSGLSQCAGLVLTEKKIAQVRHIEFVPLEPTKALVVLVGDDGEVENRVVTIPEGLPPASLSKASNFLNAHIKGRSIMEARQGILDELKTAGVELDALTAKVVKSGIAVWSGGNGDAKSLIVRGRSNLIRDLHADDDLERIQQLFDDMESKKDLIEILQSAEEGSGVRIFIGSENKRFSLSGSSIIVSPFQDEHKKVIGVLGVIGPTRLNYARIIPVVDYTARLMGRLLT
jgi:heat-inducible transcriptional repressor